jgi:hypothetical protein
LSDSRPRIESPVLLLSLKDDIDLNRLPRDVDLSGAEALVGSVSATREEFDAASGFDGPWVPRHRLGGIAPGRSRS